MLRDVCDVLGMSNPTMAAGRLDDDEISAVSLAYISSNGVNQARSTKIINEPGLYAVILRSKKPEAKAHKVLPAIRRTGGYIAGADSMTDAEIMAKALLAAQKTIQEKQTAIDTMTPKAIFADAVCANKSAILVGTLAKLLRQNGVEIGEKQPLECLHRNGFLMRQNGTNQNTLQKEPRAVHWGLNAALF